MSYNNSNRHNSSSRYNNSNNNNNNRHNSLTHSRQGGGDRYSNNRGTQNSHHHHHAKGGLELCRFDMDGGNCQYGPEKCRKSHVLSKLGETRGHTGSIKDVAIWTDRQQLFTAGSDSLIKMWNCSDWKEITTISVLNQQTVTTQQTAHRKSSSSPVRNNNNNSISSTTNTNTNMTTTTAGISVMILEDPWLVVGYESTIESGVISNDLLIGSIRAWKLDAPNGPMVYDLMTSETFPCAHDRNVTALAVVLDASKTIPSVFSGSQTGGLKFWQFDTALNTFVVKATFEGHMRGITRLKTCILPTATILISASMDCTIKIWDLSTLRCVQVLSKALNNGHENVVTDLEIWVNDTEQFLISSGLDKRIIVWALKSPFTQMFNEIQSNVDGDAEVTCLSCVTDVKDNSILLVGTSDGRILIKALPSFEYKSVLSATSNVGHRENAAIRRICVGPAHTFFSVGEDRKMVAWQWTDSVTNIKPYTSIR